MDHFMEEVVVKHNRGVENTLYILSNIVMVLAALWALMCVQMLFMQFSIYGLIEALVTAGVAVLLFLRRHLSPQDVICPAQKCDHCGIQRFQNVILQPFQHSHTSTVTGKDAESPSVTAMMRASPGAIARMVYSSPV